MTGHLPFTVIGGYLGAGKTTLLNQILTQAAGRRMAVLVNDFGSVNIDASLIRDHDGDTIALTNGCLCCSLVNGFAAAIASILARAGDFEHVIIEASGVADPAKIAQYGQMYQLPLDGILVLLDAEQIRQQATDGYVGDTVLRQLAQADLLIVNKTDLVTTSDLSELRGWLSGQAPGTPVIEARHSDVPLEVLFGHAHERAGFMPAAASWQHPEAFRTWTLEWEQPLSMEEVERLASGFGEGVYRVKGFVALESDPDRRQVYQQVGARWTLEPDGNWGTSDRRTKMIVIGRAEAGPDPVDAAAAMTGGQHDLA